MTITLDRLTAVSFAVSKESRTIKGLAVPFGVVGNNGFGSYRFTKGTLDWSKVKYLTQHDWSQAVGTVELEETDEGLVMTAKIARGARGDELLTLTEDGVYDGLSIGLGANARFEQDDDGVFDCVSATVLEVSGTPNPAFKDAQVRSVAASVAHNLGDNMPCSQCGKVHAQGVTACNAADVTAFEAAQTGPDFSAITDAITAGFEGLQFPQRETVPAGGAASFAVTEELPYRFDGIAGKHGFLADIQAAYASGDSEARQRLDTFIGEAFAVTGANVSALNPTQNRPELYVPNLTYTRPLWDLVSNGSIEDKTPFTVPKFNTASGLVGDHVEGTEPTPGAFTATNQTVSPAPVSGKIEINREVWDQGGSPQADGIIWGEMLNAYYEAIEAKIAARLATTTTTELNLASAVDGALVTALTNYFAGLQFVRGGNRFTAFAADGNLFPALVAAKDTAGRPLLPVVAPANAQGTVDAGFDRVQLGNQSIRAAWALGTGNSKVSYNFVPSSVWAWASAPKRFTFEYQVKSIDMAIWGYVGSAILRDADVKPIDYTTADA